MNTSSQTPHHQTIRRLAKTMALLLITGSITAVHAATVVDLEFVTGVGTGDTTSRTPLTDTANEYTIAWDASTPLLDASTDGQNKKIYGAFSATSAGITAPATIQVLDPSTDANDRLFFGGGKSADGDQQIRVLGLWDDDDFLASGTTEFDGTTNSTLTLGISTFANSGGGMGARFVIRDGTQFYVSSVETVLVGSTSINGATAGLQWGAFDENDFASFDSSAADVGMSVTFSAQTFSNVTGVGFLTEAARPTTNGAAFAVNDFQAVLVPEPSSILLVSLALVSLIAFRRRK